MTTVVYSGRNQRKRKVGKSSVTVLDKLGALVDNSTIASIQFLEDVLGLACNFAV
jgi:hypothetical protein